jgi:hypothetical protein
MFYKNKHNLQYPVKHVQVMKKEDQYKKDQKKIPAHWDLAFLINHKYYFIISFVTCMLVAGTYIFLRQEVFSITVTYKYNRSDTKNVITQLKDKALIRNTLRSLPFQAAYFKSVDFKKTELFGNESPVYLLFEDRNYGGTDNPLMIDILNKTQYALTDQETKTVYNYNQRLVKPYGTFTVSKSPSFPGDVSKVFIETNSLDALTQKYFEELVVVPSAGKDVVELSISHLNSKKGVLFLKTLLKKLNGADARVQQLDDSIAALSLKTQRQSPGYPIATIHTQNKRVLTAAEKNSLKKAVYIIGALLPYAKTSPQQFTQIPHTYDLGKPEVKDMVAEFNSLNLQIQHDLSNNVHNQHSLTNQRKLISVKSNLIFALENLNAKYRKLLNDSGITNNNAAVDKVEPVLFKTYTLLIQRKTAAILKRNNEINNLPVTITSDSPSHLALFWAAFLISLLLPLPLIYIKNMISANY